MGIDDVGGGKSVEEPEMEQYLSLFSPMRKASIGLFEAVEGVSGKVSSIGKKVNIDIHELSETLSNLFNASKVFRGLSGGALAIATQSNKISDVGIENDSPGVMCDVFKKLFLAAAVFQSEAEKLVSQNEEDFRKYRGNVLSEVEKRLLSEIKECSRNLRESILKKISSS